MGAQWLYTLGPIIWDFSKLQMKFNLDGREVPLQGVSSPDDKVVGEAKIAKEVQKQKEGFCFK